MKVSQEPLDQYTRLVCTHLNAFLILNPNMAMKIWNLTKNLKKSDKFGLSSAADTRVERERGLKYI